MQAHSTIGRERLSSRWTLFYQLVFPIVWIGLFGWGTISLWGADFPSRDSPPPPDMRYQFLGGWIAGTALILWLASAIRHVARECDELLIRRFRTTLRIPLALVAEVSETRFLSPKLIRISFVSRPSLPEAVRFVAPSAFQRPFGMHPTVARLQELTDGTTRHA